MQHIIFPTSLGARTTFQPNYFYNPAEARFLNSEELRRIKTSPQLPGPLRSYFDSTLQPHKQIKNLTSKLFETLYVWYYNTVPKEHHAVRHSVSVIEPSVLNTVLYRVYGLQRTTIIVRFGLEMKQWK